MFLSLHRLVRLAPLVAFLCLGLAGCGGIPFSTQMKLRNFDPLTFDAAMPRLAIFTPGYLRLLPGSAKITMTDAGQPGVRPERTEVFVLQEVRDSVPAELAAVRGEGERIASLRLAPSDLPRVRALQAEYAARKQAGAGSNKVDVKADVAACRIGDLPFGTITGSVYIKIDETTEYLPLMQAVNVRDLAKSAGTRLEDEVKPCPATMK